MTSRPLLLAAAVITAATTLLAGALPAATAAAATSPTHVYAATPGDTTSSKYQVQADGTSVPAVQYNQSGYNFDIARFSSSSRTPALTVTLPNTTINSVMINPTKYYPQSAISVSADKHTITFQMSAAAQLNYAIVRVNADSTNAAGQPYLAIINDPLENAADEPDTTSASDGSGINKSTGVLNFQTFANNYLAANPNSSAQKAPAATTSSVAGKTINGTAIPAGQQTSAGSIVSASSVNVRYPNVRAMSSTDVTYALQAALTVIKQNPTTLNTLYFPNGTYTWSGLDINGFNGSALIGGKLKIYVDEGALLKNRIQANMEAMEPAIGIWNSSNIAISGRGMFDGNGTGNYNASSSGDRHDAYNSQHQGGAMIVQSSNISFTDTYLRNAKQWNWETHTAKNVTFTNIKGLTPYALPWVDGTDFASGQNITADGVLTLGNDDAFASGHYNPSNGYVPTASGLLNSFGIGTSSPNVQGYVNAVAGYDAATAENGVAATGWDSADSDAINVSNTLGWTVAPGNGIRLGYQSMGYKLGNYTFTNVNPTSATVGGIYVMNNHDTYPRINSVTVRNSSIDTSRLTSGGISINGGDGSTQTVTAAQQLNGYAPNPNGSGSTYTYTKTPISSVVLDNVAFSKQTTNNITGVTSATFNDLSVAGQQVRYSNQLALTATSVPTLKTTYTDSSGATQPVQQNSVPAFTTPTSSSASVAAGSRLAFTVAATDPDAGDSVTLSASGLPSGATFNPASGAFDWTPTAAQAGTSPTVTFSASDAGARAGYYPATALPVTITVTAASTTTTAITANGDTWVGAWSGDQTTNNSTGLSLITRNTGQGLLGEQYTTGSGDGKITYLQFDLSSLTAAPSKATLNLTYIGHRTSSVPATDTDKVLVQPVSATSCTQGSTCPVSTMTWQSRPAFTATTSSTASSSSFTLGSTVVPEGGGSHQADAIDGRVVSIDITSMVSSAIAAGQTSLLLAAGDTSTSHELRFVSTEGASGSGKMTNATAAMAPTLNITR
ncbi:MULTISPECIES: putative Ig domain-containing protein [unclassified Curtobacterium]|uniref:putative Ig domain-containing protein n=1 Tax=unclassified Curtobacterium TaxID=257496 RepID=UPI003A811E3A